MRLCSLSPKRSSVRRRGGLFAIATLLATISAVLGSPLSGSALTGTGAGPWEYVTDLAAQPAVSNNGGPAVDGYSSGSGEVPEECTPTPPSGTTACGRGEFGGMQPFNDVLLSSKDAVNNLSGSALTFGCPTSPTAHVVASGTKTSGSGRPAVMYFPGDYTGGQGGDPGTAQNTSGDNECWTPYMTCAAPVRPNQTCSAALGANATEGQTYEAAATTACSDTTSCVRRELSASVYIAPVSPDGAHPAGSTCSGHILLAGGLVPQPGSSTVAHEASSSEYYDPRVTVNGSSNPSFNSWSPAPAMSTGRDTPGVAVLNDGRVLIAGGETDPVNIGPTANYDLFDPATCSFESVSNTMITRRYDFNLATFEPSGHVLACGGTNTNNFGVTNACEIFTPGAYGQGGTWTAVHPLNQARSGVGEQTLADGKHIVVFGGGNGTKAVSEECTDLGTTSPGCAKVLTNYANDPNFPNATENPVDMSHELIGPMPSGTPADATSGMWGIHGGTYSTGSAFKGLMLECGGFGFIGSSSLNVPTNRTCEYYVPSGRSNPGGLTCSASAGPDWCGPSSATPGAAGNIDMQRQRAYFALQELPKCNSSSCTAGLSEEVFVTGGYYGVDSAGNYLTRKNSEALVVT